MSWLAVAVIGRRSSVAALLSAASAVAWCFVFGYPQGWVLVAVLAALIWWSHRANIGRVLRGQEPKIGKS